MQKPFILLLMLALAGPLAAQTTAYRLHPDVPAAMDVAGLHLTLTEEARRLVQLKADALCRHQPSFQARVDLADGSFPIIDRVLQQEGVPLDFRYLALQESALQGDAQSIHDAVGYWQLKRETALGLGLTVNDAVDERKHLPASTRAAARYLTRSQASLRNWIDALLSYNTGLGGVRPYVLPTDAGATEMVISESISPYVLMFLAQKIAFEPACGLNPNPPLLLREFPASPGQTLAQQAQIISTDPAALAIHNRWLLANTVPADRPYTLVVPVTDVTQLAGLAANQNLASRRELLNQPAVNAKNAAEVRVNGLRALIALPGESKEELARRGNMRLHHFLRDNEMSSFDAVVAGRPYYLQSKRETAETEYHVVQTGETVADIAQKYGLKRKAVRAKNRLAHNDELRPGRVLWLAHTRPREVAVEYRTTTEGQRLERPLGSPAPLAAAPVRRPAAPAPLPAARPQTTDETTENLNDLPPAPPTVFVPTAAASPAAVAPAPPRPTARAAALPPPAPIPNAPLADDDASAEPVLVPVTRQPARAVRLPAPPVVAAPVPKPRPVPVAAAPAPTPAAIPAVSMPPIALPASGQYVVQPKETAYALARRYGLRPADLLAWNDLPPNSGLTVGQTIRLTPPAATPAAAAPAASAPLPKAVLRPAAGTVNQAAIYVPNNRGPVVETAPQPAATHTVVAGETLFSIARRYQVTVADLQTWNNKADNTARIGEVLKVKP